MITEEQIPEIVKSMNEGNPHPEGVQAVLINHRYNRYRLVVFEGLGAYDVTNPDEYKLIYTVEEVQNLRN